MIATDDLAAYLRDHGISADIHGQGDFPDSPDEIVVLDSMPGPGLSYENVFDRVAIRVRVRGGQWDNSGAEALANQVDAALIDFAVPLSIGGKHVTTVQRLASPGLADRDAADRPVFLATYVLEAAR